MQNKRLYIIFGIVVVLIAAAAFLGGRLLNGQAGALGLFPMMGGGPGTFSIQINVTPAPELPSAKPDLNGTFVERKDNVITIQTFSDMGAQGGGLVVSTGSSGGSDDGGVHITGNGGDGPKVEVVVTKDTKIYRDATDPGAPPSDANATISVQQVVVPGSLDDLKSDTMVMVWGRKNGDRIIAEVISYSTPVFFKRP